MGVTGKDRPGGEPLIQRANPVPPSRARTRRSVRWIERAFVDLLAGYQAHGEGKDTDGEQDPQNDEEPTIYDLDQDEGYRREY